MAFRFRKSIKLAPGVRLNLSKSGIGVSAGVKGARIGANSRGAYTSVGIPGTGLSSLQYHGKSSTRGSSASSEQRPEDYSLTSQFGEINVTHTSRGIAKFELEISHDGLNKYQIVKGESQEIVEQNACVKMAQWNEMWERKQEAEVKRNDRQARANAVESKKELAAERTAEAGAILAELEGILAHTIGVDDSIDWDALKGPETFPEPPPIRPTLLAVPTEPELPPKPKRSDQKYSVVLGLADKLLKSRGAKKVEDAESTFMADHAQWEQSARQLYAVYEKQRNEYKRTLEVQDSTYRAESDGWESRRAKYAERWSIRSRYVEDKKKSYLTGEASAVQEYCELVLSNSRYPDSFPSAYETGYNEANKTYVVDYQLPASEALPTLKEVKYVQKNDEFVEKEVSQAQLNRSFASVAYQIALRTIHELFEADAANALEKVVFNGYVATVDPETGDDAEFLHTFSGGRKREIQCDSS